MPQRVSTCNHPSRPTGCRVCWLLTLTPGEIMKEARKHDKERAPHKFRQTMARLQNQSYMFGTYDDDQIPTEPKAGFEWRKNGDPICLRIIYGLQTARDIEWRGPCARHLLKYRTGRFYKNFLWKAGLLR